MCPHPPGPSLLRGEGWLGLRPLEDGGGRGAQGVRVLLVRVRGNPRTRGPGRGQELAQRPGQPAREWGLPCLQLPRPWRLGCALRVPAPAPPRPGLMRVYLKGLPAPPAPSRQGVSQTCIKAGVTYRAVRGSVLRQNYRGEEKDFCQINEKSIWLQKSISLHNGRLQAEPAPSAIHYPRCLHLRLTPAAHPHPHPRGPSPGLPPPPDQRPGEGEAGQTGGGRVWWGPRGHAAGSGGGRVRVGDEGGCGHRSLW